MDPLREKCAELASAQFYYLVYTLLSGSQYDCAKKMLKQLSTKIARVKQVDIKNCNGPFMVNTIQLSRIYMHPQVYII